MLVKFGDSRSLITYSNPQDLLNQLDSYNPDVMQKFHATPILMGRLSCMFQQVGLLYSTAFLFVVR